MSNKQNQKYDPDREELQHLKVQVAKLQSQVAAITTERDALEHERNYMRRERADAIQAIDAMFAPPAPEKPAPIPEPVAAAPIIEPEISKPEVAAPEAPVTRTIDLPEEPDELPVISITGEPDEPKLTEHTWQFV